MAIYNNLRRNFAVELRNCFSIIILYMSNSDVYGTNCYYIDNNIASS